MSIEIIPLALAGEITEADDLAALVLEAAPPLAAGDVVVVTHKAVSKHEGRVLDLADVIPSERAIAMAAQHSDPRLVELIIQESSRIVRQRGPLFVAETHHGLVCANAGIDRSNAPRPDAVVLLPRDPDASARRLRDHLEARMRARVGVVVADTMGETVARGDRRHCHRGQRPGTTAGDGRAGRPQRLRADQHRHRDCR